MAGTVRSISKTIRRNGVKPSNSGNYNDNLDFKYGDDATVAYGCGATLMGQFWYFGGYGDANNRQVHCRYNRQNQF